HQVKMKGLSGFIFCSLLCFFLLSKTLWKEDCSQIKAQSPHAHSGVYVIQPSGTNTQIKVYCEMRLTDGWIVIQRRSGGLVSFERRWAEYEFGFGSLTYDHWLGLEKIHLLTKDTTKMCTLRVDLWDHEGGTAFAEYRNFKIGDEQTAYQLHVGTYSGNAGDAIRGAYPGVDQNGSGFSTIDRDNDNCSPCVLGDIALDSCAQNFGSGWWYSSCGSAALHGDWHSSDDPIGWQSGLHWHTWKPMPYSAKATRMTIKCD
uniref:Fibrinogen-like protein 1 n=1 Tax=Fundulus heteroclitus TaxID=8078 RepID=A0A3Q2QXA1_FUNHE